MENERTEGQLIENATLYDWQSDDVFEYGFNENLRKPHNAEFLEDAGEIFDFMDKGRRQGRLGDRLAPLSMDEKFLLRRPPADNMGPVMYRGQSYPARWGGYDGGVEASIYGTWGDLFGNFSLALERAKTAADSGDFENMFVEFGGFVWKVSEKGANAGFFKYKWVVESHGVKVYIHSNPRGNCPPVRVRFGFECLARTNLFVAVETLKKALLDVSFDWEYETLSRVDMQVLIPVDIYEFIEAMKGNCIVTRCRGKCEIVSDCHSMRVQTITFRSSSAELCIYDKKAHLESADSVYYTTFHRWILGFSDPEFLTRVEFRFRRGMLRRYGISSFDDLRRSQRALPQVFGRDWFRILSRDKVRGSENEISLAPIWQKTLDLFECYFSTYNNNERTDVDLVSTKEKHLPPKAEQVLKQALGCFSSVLAHSGQVYSNVNDLLEVGITYLKNGIDVIFSKVTRKQIINEVVRGFTPEERKFYDCLDEIYQALTPLSVVQYLEYY